MRTNWMNLRHCAMGLTSWVLMTLQCHAQGFINFNFESANIPDVPTNQVGSLVSVSLGMPGWSASYLVGPDLIGHNTVSGGGAAVAIEGPFSPASQILEGNYTAYVFGSLAGPPKSGFIAQTAQIPNGSLSLQFWVNQSAFSLFQVTF